MKNKPPITQTHPLDPPTAQEIEQAAHLAKQHLSDKAAFHAVSLVDPAKDIVRDFGSGSSIDRRLKLVGYDYPMKVDGGFDAIVNLTSKDVEVNRIEEGQAPIGFADVMLAVKIIKEDPGWLAAVASRGITDIANVQIDPWPAGGYTHPSIPQGNRAFRGIAFVREDKTDNGYARPIQGLLAHVDLSQGCVTHLEDHEVKPLPPESGRFLAEDQPQLRPPLSNLEITQPGGIGFVVHGHAVHWQGWEFRVGIHPSYGLELHQLGYRENGNLRPILYRAGLSDMVVPYGDPDPMHRWKHVLDAGEATIGNCANSLKLGCDCLGEIHYLDHVAIKPDGSPRIVERAICIHEEDFGTLWKHSDGYSNTSAVRRSRRLVVSTFYTIGNYDYGFYWYLYLDGTIQMEVKLTGIVGVSAIEDGEERPAYAPLIAPNLTSPIHQHLFCFRLDFELDGEHNSVYEVNTIAEPVSETNPDGTVFGAQEQLLQTESSAIRDANPQSGRFWKIVNPHRKNRLGKSVAYRLVPDASPTMYATESSQVANRATFARHNLWVTPHSPEELSAAGDYPNQSPGGAGLPRWTAQDRNLQDTDVVIWHTVGSTHIPRPEDWPVMPVAHCGFKLQPVGFFERNPALDLPPPHH